MITRTQHGRGMQIILSLLAGIIFCSSVFADEDNPLVIQDLHFGETLFHFYQENYFTAISDLLVAQQKYPIKTQGKEPELLLGGLYLSYNMSKPASKIFKSLTKTDISKKLNSSAWYYLARIAYQENDLKQAQYAASKVGVYLPYRYNDEFHHLQGNIYLKQKKYNDAIKILGNFSGSTEWENYAKYNLAIALILTDKYKQGISLLKDVAKINTTDIEQLALRDKANLALGYTALREKQHEKAASYFKKIRLVGSQSNKALLGIGWAFHKDGRLKRALVPWVELKNRSSKDPAVQEALLTIPHALEGLNAKEQALAYYNDAINSYNNELNSLDNVIKLVKTGEFVTALRSQHQYQQKENHLHYTTLPDSIATPYLQDMIAEHNFQIILKNYSDLLYMRNILRHWNNQMPAYHLMLNEREKAYDSRAPKIRAFLKNTRQAKLHRQYIKLKTHFDKIEQQHDVLALASEQELDILIRLKKIKQILDQNPSSEELEKQRDQHRLFSGIIYWQIATNFTPRHWQLKKELKEVEKAFAQLDKTKNSSLGNLVRTPQYFDTFAKRINQKHRKLQQLSSRISRRIKLQENLINRLAIDNLKQQKHLIENYHIRASYSLTRLYDSLAAVEKKQ